MKKLALCAFFLAGSLLAQQSETVMVKYHAKPGSETELARVIEKHWKTVSGLKLVRDTPHVMVQGTEGGKTYFVEIFTWRDGNTPDSAPPAIQSIWAEMGKLVEARGGKPGIDFVEVSVVTP